MWFSECYVTFLLLTSNVPLFNDKWIDLWSNEFLPTLINFIELALLADWSFTVLLLFLEQILNFWNYTHFSLQQNQFLLFISDLNLPQGYGGSKSWWHNPAKEQGKVYLRNKMYLWSKDFQNLGVETFSCTGVLNYKFGIFLIFLFVD